MFTPELCLGMGLILALGASFGCLLPQKCCCPGVGPVQASIYLATVPLSHDLRIAPLSEWVH